MCNIRIGMELTIADGPEMFNPLVQTCRVSVMVPLPAHYPSGRRSEIRSGLSMIFMTYQRVFLLHGGQKK